MEGEEEDVAGVGGSWGGIGGIFTPVGFLGIKSTKAEVLEDSSTFKFSDSLIIFWELDASVEEDLNGGRFNTTE